MEASNSPRPVVEARGIVKRYGGTPAVDGVSLSIAAGTCYALLGPNGAGKSTLSRVLGAVAMRDAGELSVFGMDPSSQGSEVKNRLGWVMQEDALDEELCVEDNLRVWAGFFGIAGAAARARAKELLALVGLEGRERMPIPALSGGMRRRLVIARALLSDPEFLILDEPTTGLDPQVRHAIWTMMRRLRSEGRTLLLTTHYMDEAAQMADRVGVMEKGRLVAEDTPAALVAKHVKAFVLEIPSAPADAESRLAGTGAVLRRHGDVVAAYHDDERVLRAALVDAALVRAVVRPSTLEDVFLELTGRHLDA